MTTYLRVFSTHDSLRATRCTLYALCMGRCIRSYVERAPYNTWNKWVHLIVGTSTFTEHHLRSVNLWDSIMMTGWGWRRYRRCRDFRPESIGVALEHLSYGLLANLFIFDVVAATITVAVSAVFSTGEALTVELEAPWVLAIAIFLILIRLRLIGWPSDWGLDRGHWVRDVRIVEACRGRQSSSYGIDTREV